MAEISKTQQALELLKADPTLSAYAAAKQVGISKTAVYNALNREKGRDRCPTCGQLLPEGAAKMAEQDSD